MWIIQNITKVFNADNATSITSYETLCLDTFLSAFNLQCNRA